MARVHTDFIAIPNEVFAILLDILSDYDGVLVFKDIPLNRQQSKQRILNKSGFYVFKRQYVK